MFPFLIRGFLSLLNCRLISSFSNQLEFLFILVELCSLNWLFLKSIFLVIRLFPLIWCFAQFFLLSILDPFRYLDTIFLMISLVNFLNSEELILHQMHGSIEVCSPSYIFELNFQIQKFALLSYLVKHRLLVILLIIQCSLVKIKPLTVIYCFRLIHLKSIMLIN